MTLENLKTTIANCPTFQDLVDEEDAEGAKDHIFKITDRTATIPCAVIGWPGEFRYSQFSSGRRNHFLKDGDMFMLIRSDINSSHSDEVASDVFMNAVGDIVEEMSQLAGLSGYLNINQLRVDMPQRPIEVEKYTIKKIDGTLLNDFYQAEIAVSYTGF
jgi:hypothetical protein